MRKSLMLMAVCALFLAGCSSTPVQTEAEQQDDIDWAMGSTAAAVPEPAPTVEAPAGLPALAVTAAMELGMHEDWGWPTESGTENITGFSERDLPRVTVATNLADKAENEQAAQGICNLAKLTIKTHNIDATGVYVTAGEGGAFLATCDA